MRLTTKIVLLVAFIGFVVVNMTWSYLIPYIGEELAYKVYYVAEVFNALGYAYVIYSLTPLGHFKSIAKGIALICLSSVVDELFFDPKVLELNEIIAAILIMLFTIEDLLNYNRNTNII